MFFLKEKKELFFNPFIFICLPWMLTIVSIVKFDLIIKSTIGSVVFCRNSSKETKGFADDPSLMFDKLVESK